MKDGFLKAAALSPALRVADCTYNTAQIIQQLREAAGRGVKLAVFPEFCLTGYTCGDLFLQRTLAAGCADRLAGDLGRQPGAGRGGAGGAAAAGAGQAVQLRCRPLPRAAAGPCAQDLPAQLRRVLRKAPVHPRLHRGGNHYGLRPAGALRHLAALPLPGDAELRAGRRDLRGSVERPAALHLPRPRRGHRHREPFGQRRDRRQGGIPPGIGGEPVRPSALRLPVRFRRARREHAGHGLCGPRPHC